ncbi:MAG TPA: chorismate synthase, partial [Armatimonadota bacterium]|nr:chorismate synthase [Armatimonadota bacterium]
RDFSNWTEIMSATGEPTSEKAFTRPRPGHADLAGYYKYGHTDLRDVLERSSARETTARVAAGALARALLLELGIEVFSHVTVLGGIAVSSEELPESPEAIRERAESNDLRCAASEETLVSIRKLIDETRKAGTTLGGEVEVVVTGLPPGLGSYVQWDRRLDGQLAQAVMSIQAVKSVSIGDGELGARVPGSDFHDAIVPGGTPQTLTRPTNRAGGLEGGVTNGMPLVVRAAMKPISTLMKPLGTVDLRTGERGEAVRERSDVCALPAAGVVGEAMVAIVLAGAVLEKFGGDSLTELRRNWAGYQEQLRVRSFGG